MTEPVFEEYEAPADCPCAGCAHHRRELALGLPVRAGGHPGAHGARRALVLATAAGVVLGGGGAGAAQAAVHTTAPPLSVDLPGRDTDPGTPQGGAGPLHGRPSAGPTTAKVPVDQLRRATRADIINRAKVWVTAEVPYSMEKYWSDGYRQDCSGFVSMAWGLSGNEWTGSLDRFAARIGREDLQPGDILLFHNPDDPTKGSHVTIFGGWTDYTHTYYIAYEQAKPHTRKQSTPMAYWNNSARYLAYRYKGLVPGSTAGPASAGYPGDAAFGPGTSNAHVTRLGEMLVERGGKRFYAKGPGPRWGDADRRATQAFQKAQGWAGSDADGLPGPKTWKLLVEGAGKDIAPVTGAPPAAGAPAPAQALPGYPGKGVFRPGRSSADVTRLGQQLVRKGFGKYYAQGPGPRWGEADRRAVEAFQRAQGWRGAAADGYPGPETWRRLFR
ncbi:peptidoglycan-binding protein [Streptomyces sp. NPDC001941]|uniref:peptidoglycan-binding protein n=1 Tax=Streptomyces sp. NPDC001941 TaxID=3154659 RepID=UPI0033186EDC